GVPFERHGPVDAALRLPGTVNLRIPGRTGEGVVLGLDLRGVAIGLGAACSSGAARPSHVLEAMGLDRRNNVESFRVSCGPDTSERDAAEAARRLVELCGTTLPENRQS
ncbi:MAG TPA: hypothetical protein VEI02_10015, partial [Planctomycetota bacterium]|nr:hypothetical protein [Planctomycetota bacterium]